MNLLCFLGFHRWVPKATARQGTTVYRCGACNAVTIKHRGRGRQKKRFWLIAGGIFCLFAWYVIIALGTTKHTKVLWGAKKVAHAVHHGTVKVDRRVRRVVGAPEHQQDP